MDCQWGHLGGDMALREGGRMTLNDLVPSLFLQVTLRSSQPPAQQ